ncbi:MAG TPA: Na+/H+ antiporter NhaA [Rhizomicrobium sp.]|jgi:NhaA family Na+:H+ antiporter
MTGEFWLRNAVDRARDHVRGGEAAGHVVNVVTYADFLCPYCRRLRAVLRRLRAALGERFAYIYRHFPNERAHPGAEFASRASEAAANQGRFWEMHDALYDRHPPLTEDDMRELARKIGLDMTRFERDVNSHEVRARVAEDLAEARDNGVTGTPTLFIDGLRYDGAWDFYSLLNKLEQPVADRIQRSARAFASLPASGGLVLILAAFAALAAINSPLAPFYSALIHAPFGIGPPGSLLSLSVGDWFSEGLLSFFFLLVGLEVRREMSVGALSERKAATLPIVAAIGGTIVPACLYLLVNRGAAASGWSVPTATGLPFALAILALFGDRISPSLRVFVAAFAVVDDIISVVILAVFYPRNFEIAWLVGAAGAGALMYALNRWRVYTIWPYLVAAIAEWFFLHSAGVDAALAGIALAAFLPARPFPNPAPLLAQAATALAELEAAENEAQSGDLGLVREWASRNLSAASERLLSPADRIEKAVAPWSTYFVLPLFAFSATGVGLHVDLSAPNVAGVFWGTILGQAFGKPLGVCASAWLAIRTNGASLAEDIGLRAFLGAAFLCGIGDTVSLLFADEAFPANADAAAVAKIGVLIGSVLAAALGALIIGRGSAVPRTAA